MKRVGYIFEKCFTLEKLFKAYEVARKGKRRKSQVINFERDLGANLQLLLDELLSETYKPCSYSVFTVYEPKPRLIHAPHFRDIVVQHALYAELYPIFDSTFIYDNYGCRKYKGTHRAADKAQEFLRNSQSDSYTLKLDLRKFFYRIDREILIKLISKKIKDPKVITLITQFIDYPDSTGIPIGNLLSQLFSLVYLNHLDHYIKRELKVKYYVRYVDDFILFNLTKEQAWEFHNKIEVWLYINLRMEISKFTIAKVNKGVNFVGFRTFRKTRFIRKHSMYNFKRVINRNKINSIISILGNAKHTASYKYLLGLIKQPEIIKQIYRVKSLP